MNYHKPQISLIAAMSKNHVIGYKGQMPWHLPADLQHFKKLTLGKPVIMGRKTYDSIGCPLPNRRNIVLTRKNWRAIENIEVFTSLSSALAGLQQEREIMIVGGSQIFIEALPIADYLYLTYIDLEIEGDTFFPQINIQEWQQIQYEKHDRDDKNPYAYAFVEMQRL